jgi:hypothetical protein
VIVPDFFPSKDTCTTRFVSCCYLPIVVVVVVYGADIASTDIAVGDELFVDYGPMYWQPHAYPRPVLYECKVPELHAAAARGDLKAVATLLAARPKLIDSPRLDSRLNYPKGGVSIVLHGVLTYLWLGSRGLCVSNVTCVVLWLCAIGEMVIETTLWIACRWLDSTIRGCDEWARGDGAIIAETRSSGGCCAEGWSSGAVLGCE